MIYHDYEGLNICKGDMITIEFTDGRKLVNTKVEGIDESDSANPLFCNNFGWVRLSLVKEITVVKQQNKTSGEFMKGADAFKEYMISDGFNKDVVESAMDKFSELDHVAYVEYLRLRKMFTKE